MKKIYHLSTCNTCQRIIKELNPPQSTVLQDVKTNPVTPEQLQSMYAHTQSYEALFNRRAQLYRKRDLHNQELTENDYKALILEHYTFLKRPVIITNETIFVGNSKKTVAAAITAFNKK